MRVVEKRQSLKIISEDRKRAKQMEVCRRR